MRSEHVLFYHSEAKAWTDALPLGNGRIGAMAFSGIARDRFQINEDTLWSGYPRVSTREGAPDALREARKLLSENHYHEAEKVLEQGFTGSWTQAYMPLGDLYIATPASNATAEDYVRSLDLETGVSTCTFRLGGVTHTRQSFVSSHAAHPALFIRYAADAPGAVSADISFDCPLKSEVTYAGGEILISGECPGQALPQYLNPANPLTYSDSPAERGMRFHAAVDIRAEGGTVTALENCLRVVGADAVTLVLSARSSFAGYNRHPFVDGLDSAALLAADRAAAAEISFEEALATHIPVFSEWMNRVDLRLSATQRSEKPTDERLRAYDGAKGDDQLIELMYNYGRYLLISSSQPGTQAANLQGIWNLSTLPPWSSNYTININTEMNYFPAEMCALPEMHEPMFDLIERLTETGQRTARDYYRARGAVAHHNADLWAQSNPVGNRREGSVVWAFWPMSLGWMCRHMFDHYLYTMDADFLLRRALPAMELSARFYLDVLQEDAEGHLTISPITSPENSFIIDGRPCPLAKSSQMAVSIVRELFSNYLSALDVLRLNPPMAEEVRVALPRLMPFRIGSRGQILEWDQEYEEVEPEHRHTSHLYGLHPGHEIDPERTPELAEAARRTLQLRGDGGTGWSLGWKINFYARLRDGDHALKLLNRQLDYAEWDATLSLHGGGTYLNLFDAHPPFQIDGNFAFTSGVTEMLLQSAPDRLTLFPALPSAWTDGEIRGLRGMGRTRVDLTWTGGKPISARITADENTPFPMRVFLGSTEIGKITAPGETTFQLG